MISLKPDEFTCLVKYIESNYGINLEKKLVLVEVRLNSLIAQKGFTNFTDYFNYILKDPTKQELMLFVSKLTTNYTFFYREEKHFNYLRDVILPQLIKSNKEKEIRIWSAGCAYGDEPYSIAMLINDFLGINKLSWSVKIIATDISKTALDFAREGIYPTERLASIPETWKLRYFQKLDDGRYQINDFIKADIEFKSINLMSNFLFYKKFHVLFCRNVMIYFSANTKNKLVQKFYEVIEQNGYLFIGHSETVKNENNNFTYICPAIYQK